MKISDMIASAKYYWCAKANQSTNTEYKYYRELRSEDEINFKECKIVGSKKPVYGRRYFNVATKEISIQSPNEVDTITHEMLSWDHECITIIKATAAGFVSAGASILLGYSIVTLGKGALIGAAIGAIKAYVDSVAWKETPIWIVKEPELIQCVRQTNGEPFPEKNSNVDHTS